MNTIERPSLHGMSQARGQAQGSVALQVRVFDRNGRLSKDDFLGQITLPQESVEAIPAHTGEAQKYDLRVDRSKPAKYNQFVQGSIFLARPRLSNFDDASTTAPSPDQRVKSVPEPEPEPEPRVAARPKLTFSVSDVDKIELDREQVLDVFECVSSCVVRAGYQPSSQARGPSLPVARPDCRVHNVINYVLIPPLSGC